MQRLTWVGSMMAVACVFQFSGCGSSTTGGSVFTKGLQLPPGTNAIVALKSTAAASRMGGTNGTMDPDPSNVVINAGSRVILKEIKLYQVLPVGAVEDDEAFEVKLIGPFVVDLVDETITNLGSSRLDLDSDDDGINDVDDSDDDNDGVDDDADDDDDGDGIPDVDDQNMHELKIFDVLDIPAGDYRRIKFVLAPLSEEEAPGHDMVGLSVSISGSVGVPSVAFEFCSDHTASVDVRSSTPITVDSTNVATFLMTLDPRSWFAGIDPAAGTISGEGKLIMCDGQNTVLADIVRQTINSHIHLNPDADGDGNEDDNGNDNVNGNDNTADNVNGNDNNADNVNGNDNTADNVNGNDNTMP